MNKKHKRYLLILDVANFILLPEDGFMTAETRSCYVLLINYLL